MSATEAQQLSILNGVTCFLVVLIGVMIVYMLMIPQDNLDRIKFQSEELVQKEREYISRLDDYEALQREIQIRNSTKTQMIDLVNQFTPQLEMVDTMKGRISQLETEKAEMETANKQLQQRIDTINIPDHLAEMSDISDDEDSDGEVHDSELNQRVENIDSIQHLEELGMVHDRSNRLNQPIPIDVTNGFNNSSRTAINHSVRDDESVSSTEGIGKVEKEKDDESKSSVNSESDDGSVSSIETVDNKPIPITPIAPVAQISSLDYGIKVSDLDTNVINPTDRYLFRNSMESIQPIQRIIMANSPPSSPTPRYQRFRSLMSNYDEQ